MSAGVECCESAIKLSRKWGYNVKKVPENEARHVFASGNFWGRSITAISSSDDPACRNDFGPFMTGFSLVPYDNLSELDVSISLTTCLKDLASVDSVVLY